MISFIESLPQDLREEQLLGADFDLMARLP